MYNNIEDDDDDYDDFEAVYTENNASKTPHQGIKDIFNHENVSFKAFYPDTVFQKLHSPSIVGHLDDDDEFLKISIQSDEIDDSPSSIKKIELKKKNNRKRSLLNNSKFQDFPKNLFSQIKYRIQATSESSITTSTTTTIDQGNGKHVSKTTTQTKVIKQKLSGELFPTDNHN